jgi:uncharacterized membrane protein (UPF0182 family)
VKNIRLWDDRPLLQVYSQRQDLRTYYDISKVDVDRYQVNGQMRQVMLAARELNVNNLGSGQDTWLNRHFIYTHGYGLVMSPVNEVNPDKGEPNFFISNIPPESTVPGLAVTRPEIYFGEMPDEYIVVKSGQKEFDYPTSGDDNAYTTYGGTAGIPLNTLLARAAAASRFGDFNLLISNLVTPQSRLVYRRNIVQRTQALAPFLSFDADPYLVVGTDGKLYWMMDAYTASDRYPYAQYSTLQTANGDVSLNYLRNSVKVVIDAYSGATTFYLADSQEPIIRAWQATFPGMFHPLSEMPAGLTQHVRVPEGMFNTISDVYRRYHMVEANTFYQQEDLWDLPQEQGTGQSGSDMAAYYVAMSLPGQHAPEYLLIRPYTPHQKKNMIAWLSARSDPQHYGQLLVYDFPKQSQVYGPEQIHVSINQDPDISSAVSLWNQSGSQVVWGNLLVIPIGKTILYVQPLYLQAEQSQIPELQRVIVADQQRVVMRNTLDEALAALTGGSIPAQEEAPAAAPAAPSATPSTAPAAKAPAAPVALTAAERVHARSALDHYNKAQQAMQHGDWTTYGKEMDAVHHELQALNGQ